jgi:tetratricopeptide (TPR) repeat protein
MSERFLDVSHEALIRGWPRLRGWLDEDRAGLRLQRRITETADEWQRSNRDNDLLYRGTRLIQAQEWRARHEVELNPLEREFLDASIALKQRLEEQEREQQQRELQAARKLAEAERKRAEEQIKARRRQRYLSYGLAVLLLGTVLVAFFAYRQQLAAVRAEKKTREAASRGSVLLARSSRESGKNAQALAQFARALRLNPENREASGCTVAMLMQLSWQIQLTGSMRHRAAVNSARFSPDGQRVVTASDDRTARLWDSVSGKPIGEPMKHEDVVNSAQFSPDGQRVVTASQDQTARLWDSASSKQIGEPMKHEDGVYSAQFSPDGQRVVTASGTAARLWDAATGKPIGEPMKHESRVNSAQFSPDGQRVVTGSSDYTARLWDALSGKPVGEPMKHEGGLTFAEFSSDGKRVVTASVD